MTHEGEIVLRRSLAADGKSRAFINDEAGGRGAAQGYWAGCCWKCMARPMTAGCSMSPPIAACWMLSAAWKSRRARWRRCMPSGTRRAMPWPALKARAAEAAEERRLCARRGQANCPTSIRKPGEEESLAGERALMMNAARIAEDLTAASEALSGERGAEAALASALKKLSRLQEEARKRVAGGRSRAGTGLCPDRRSAARTGCAAVQPGYRHGRAGTQGRAAVRPARAGPQIRHHAGRACPLCWRISWRSARRWTAAARR